MAQASKIISESSVGRFTGEAVGIVGDVLVKRYLLALVWRDAEMEQSLSFSSEVTSLSIFWTRA
jgi:hypothetical protein